MKRSLLLGCGHSRVKKVFQKSHPDWVGELTTIDMNPDCGADIVTDVGHLLEHGYPLPFPDETFDEMAAYDTLEHWGRQGDWKGWFDECAEYWRILKPGGTFGIIVPVGNEALADPGHTRFFGQNHFGFLLQRFYEANLAEGRPITDYRWYWKRNFEILHMQDDGAHLSVLLRKA